MPRRAASVRRCAVSSGWSYGVGSFGDVMNGKETTFFARRQLNKRLINNFGICSNGGRRRDEYPLAIETKLGNAFADVV